VVAEIVVQAATAVRPRIRYAPGLARRMRLLRRFAPVGVLDAGVRKDLRLDTPPTLPPRPTAATPHAR